MNIHIPFLYRPTPAAARHVILFLFYLLSLILFREPLGALVDLSLHDARYSHLVTIPFITLCLIYLDKRKISTGFRYCPELGVPLLLAGATVFWLVNRYASFSVELNDRLPLLVLAIVLIWIAGFILCCGVQSFRAALFPWCFLFLLVPIPPMLLDKIVVALQKGSAEISFVLFKVVGIPILRQGLTFSLPGVDVEVGKECSGIRSSVSLLIASILAGHVFLRTAWRKACLCLLTVPVVIFKNAVRIVGISWLGLYVTPDFFQGKLHHQYGGLVFSLLSLAMQLSMLFMLQYSETASHTPGILSAMGGWSRKSLSLVLRERDSSAGGS